MDAVVEGVVDEAVVATPAVGKTYLVANGEPNVVSDEMSLVGIF